MFIILQRSEGEGNPQLQQGKTGVYITEVDEAAFLLWIISLSAVLCVCGTWLPPAMISYCLVLREWFYTSERLYLHTTQQYGTPTPVTDTSQGRAAPCKDRRIGIRVDPP